MNESHIQQAVADILAACQPLRILQFAEKTHHVHRQAQGVQPVRHRAGRHGLPRAAHAAASGAVGRRTGQPERLHAEEWEDLLTDETSYAAWIARKGQVVYDPET